MTDWFRSWHGAPTDAKWLLIASKAGVKPCHAAYTFWALLDHASQHSERGFVGDFDEETFALFAGLEIAHVSRLVTAMRDKRLIVNDRIANWGKRQPKKEDATATERQRRHRADNQDNQPPSGTPGTPEHHPKGDGHAVSRAVTLEQSRADKNREEGSVTDVTGTVVPHPAASDFCKAIFDGGVALLVASGKPERDARSILGRWRKTVGDAELLTILRDAESKSEPVEWITATVESRNGKRNLRGSRPDPAVDLKHIADAELAAESAGEDQGADFGIGVALPPYLTG